MCFDPCSHAPDTRCPEDTHPQNEKNGKSPTDKAPPKSPEDRMPPTDKEIANAPNAPEKLKKQLPPEYELKVLDGVVYAKNKDESYTRLGTYSETKGFQPDTGMPPSYLGFGKANAEVKAQFPNAKGEIYVGEDGRLWLQKADGSWAYLGQRHSDGNITRSAAPEAKGPPSNKEIEKAPEAPANLKKQLPPGAEAKLLDGVVYMKKSAGEWQRVGTYSEAKGFQPDKDVKPETLGFGKANAEVKAQFPNAKGEIYVGEDGRLWLQKADGSWTYLGQRHSNGTVTRSNAPEARSLQETVEKAPEAPASLKKLLPPGSEVKLMDGVVYMKNSAGEWKRVGTYSEAKGFQPDKDVTPETLGFGKAHDDVKAKFPNAKGEIYVGEDNQIWLRNADGSWVRLGKWNGDGTVTRSTAPEAYSQQENIENAPEAPANVKKLFPPGSEVKLIGTVVLMKDEKGEWKRVGLYSEAKGFQPDKGIKPETLGFGKAHDDVKAQFPNAKGEIYVGEDNQIWLRKADGTWVRLGTWKGDGTVTRSSAPEAQSSFQEVVAAAPEAPANLKKLLPAGSEVKLMDGVVYMKDNYGEWKRVGTYSQASGFQPDKDVTPESLGFGKAHDDVKAQFPNAEGEIYVGEDNQVWLRKADGTWVRLGTWNGDGTVTRSSAPEAAPSEDDIAKAEEPPEYLKQLLPPGAEIKLVNDVVYMKDGSGNWKRVGIYTILDGFKPDQGVTPETLGFGKANDTVKAHFPNAQGEIYVGEYGYIWLQKADGTWTYLGVLLDDNKTIVRSTAPEAKA